MKAVTAMCPTGATVTGGVTGGRISRRRDAENEEIQMYLSKLKELVPFMPKNRKLSKLEVIQNVIEYICDLQTALELHPAVNGFDAAAALNNNNVLNSATLAANRTSSAATTTSHHHQSQRQPLGVLPNPNTILPTSPCESSNVTITTTATATQQMIIPTPEKLSPSDGRPVSC